MSQHVQEELDVDAFRNLPEEAVEEAKTDS